MFVTKLFALSMLTACSAAMASGSTGDGGSVILGLLMFVFLLAMYFLPALIASKKEHTNLTSIALVNFFLGWTLLGWVFCLAWAFKKSETVTVISPTAPAPIAAASAAPPAAPAADTRLCPFCAEEVKVQAIKCKHCQADLSATAA